jgi:1,4-dihydroxy-2-naphthoate octaprenyltransferase
VLVGARFSLLDPTVPLDTFVSTESAVTTSSVRHVTFRIGEAARSMCARGIPRSCFAPMNRWVAGARPRTLPAAIVPVLVGTAAAAEGDLGAGRGLVAWRFVAALVVALGIQVGTNYANDYSDGVRGTDSEDRVGPVRLVGSGLASASAVKRASLVSFSVAAVAGLLLAVAVTPWLLVVGAVSFAAGWLYTGGPRPYGYYGFGELFVFVFFGLVATMGSAYVQSEELTWLAFGSSIPVGMLATALLVINNLRDIPTDAVAGKRTLAVRLGDRRTRIVFVVLMVLPYVITPLVAGLGGRPLASVALFTILLARLPVQHVIEGARGVALIPVLGETGRVQLVFGLTFAAGLYFGS